MTTLEIELAISNFFGIRRHLIVPNIGWGLGLHECDLLVITKSGLATEIEIKTNKYDLKRDAKKYHGHNSNKIRRLFFAVPKEFLAFSEYIPEKAGIISCDGNYCKIERIAKINKDAKPLDLDQLLHLGRLASMRIWSLKQTIANRRKYEEEIILTYEEA